MDAAADIGGMDAPRFFVTASHELRTPLTGVLGYLELVLEDGHLGDEHRRHLEVAHRCGERLLRAVEDLFPAGAGDAASLLERDSGRQLG